MKQTAFIIFLLTSYIIEIGGDASWPKLSGVYDTFIKMTKLMQWLSLAIVFLTIWIALLTDNTPFQLSEASREVIWAMPIYLLMTFACYSLAVIGYRVATFNDCEAAAAELKQQIIEAKADLKTKGLDIS